MEKFKLVRTVYALYILNERLVSLFESHEDACEIGKKYYSNLSYYVVPYMVYEIE